MKSISKAPSPQSSKDMAALPANFKSPFNRVPMRERMDDALACVAILTAKTLDEVNSAAISLGYPPHGPAYATETLQAKLLMSLGGLVARNYQDFISIAALPEVAILYIDYDEDMDVGRTVVWHHVRGTEAQTAFNYVIDPASWIDEARYIHTDVKSLRISWYMEIRSSNKPALQSNSGQGAK